VAADHAKAKRARFAARPCQRTRSAQPFRHIDLTRRERIADQRGRTTAAGRHHRAAGTRGRTGQPRAYSVVTADQ